jgi:hypothetical protein
MKEHKGWSQEEIQALFNKVKTAAGVPQEQNIPMPKLKVHTKVFIIGTEGNQEYDDLCNQMGAGEVIKGWEHVYDSSDDKIKVGVQWFEVEKIKNKLEGEEKDPQAKSPEGPSFTKLGA